MEVNSPTILDYGNLAVGAGTFILAIVLGITNYSRSIRDRKVHMADKRHEWINEFRENVAQILSISSEINILREAGLYDQANAIFSELRLKVNLVRLMLDKNIEDSHVLLEKLGNLLVHSFGHDLSQDFLALDNEVYSASQKIINKEWSRIENLQY